MPRRLLLILPHPDDEVYGAAGTILDVLEAGGAVRLVTLTRGEAGRSLGLADSPEELARLRGAELAACLEVLGVSEHVQKDFPDRRLDTVPLEELQAVVRDALAFAPDTVITFAPNGGNGHPDHVTTSRAVLGVWEALPAAQRPALWLYAGPTPEDPQLLAGYHAPDLHRDVSRHLTRKLTAIACHRSQALSTVDFIRKFPGRVVTETFHTGMR